MNDIKNEFKDKVSCVPNNVAPRKKPNIICSWWERLKSLMLTDVTIGFAKHRYKVSYLECHGCMSVVEEDYFCYAINKYEAWMKFKKDVGVEGHYTCREVLSSFNAIKEDIHLIL